MRPSKLLSILLFLVVTECYGKDPNSELPNKVTDLQRLLTHKNREEAYKLTIDFLGKPVQKVGSGFRIEQWDLDGGILTFHQTLGPTFRDTSGSITWLVTTRNELKANLHNRFEIYSLHEQDPHKNGNIYWLGNIELFPDGKFAYRDSGRLREYKNTFPKHFFEDHLTENFNIDYSEGISSTDVLEEIPDDKEVCKITFRSGEGSKTFNIVTSRSARMLRFDSKNQVFRMQRGWNTYWPQKIEKAAP